MRSTTGIYFRSSFISDLHKRSSKLSKTDPRFFADDTALLIDGKNFADVESVTRVGNRYSKK